MVASSQNGDLEVCDNRSTQYQYFFLFLQGLAFFLLFLQALKLLVWPHLPSGRQLTCIGSQRSVLPFPSPSAILSAVPQFPVHPQPTALDSCPSLCLLKCSEAQSSSPVVRFQSFSNFTVSGIADLPSGNIFSWLPGWSFPPSYFFFLAF